MGKFYAGAEQMGGVLNEKQALAGEQTPGVRTSNQPRRGIRMIFGFPVVRSQNSSKIKSAARNLNSGGRRVPSLKMFSSRSL
jgi:hypothetical protein